MEEKTLTTAPDEEHVETNDEQQQDEPQVEQKTTTETSYDDAWDSIDVDNPETVDKVFAKSDGQEEEENNGNSQEEEDWKQSEEEAARKAFMDAAPVLKFKGKEVPIDSPDEIVALAQKGLSFENDMSKIKPYKKVINTVADVPLEVLQAVADLHQGKKEALDYLKEHYGIEDKSSDGYDFGYDNEEEKKSKSTYQPEVKDDDPVKEYWDSVVNENTELAAAVTKVYSDIDSEFQNALYDPNIFPAFVNSVSTGEFDEVYPIALKEKSLNPAMDWITAYQTAANKLQTPESRKSEPPASAQPPKTNSNRSLDENVTADEIWADDEAFERMQKQIFG